MHIILLTHQRESLKKTNTGQLVLLQSGIDVTRIIWNRSSPDAWLLRIIAMGSVFLLYPEYVNSDQLSPDQLSGSTDSLESDDIDCRQASTSQTSFIIIDSTWQEARKIFNRSPYLASVPRITLAPSKKSLFNLRRNQITGGLCTAESVVALLRMNHHNHLANKLETDFYRFVGHVCGEG